MVPAKKETQHNFSPAFDSEEKSIEETKSEVVNDSFDEAQRMAKKEAAIYFKIPAERKTDLDIYLATNQLKLSEFYNQVTTYILEKVKSKKLLITKYDVKEF